MRDDAEPDQSLRQDVDFAKGVVRLSSPGQQYFLFQAKNGWH